MSINLAIAEVTPFLVFPGAPVTPSISDHGTVVLGGSFRLPIVHDPKTTDRGMIILGGGFRQAAPRQVG